MRWFLRFLLRRLIGLAWTLSMLLFAALSVMWVRSYLAMDRVWFDVRPRDRTDIGWGWLCLQSGKGGLGFWYNRIEVPDERPAGRTLELVHGKTSYVASEPQYPNEWDGVAAGAFYWENRHGRSPGQLPIFVGGIKCSVPYWAVWTITLPGTIGFSYVLVVRQRRRRRSLANCCVACGYALRASADRCPECGAPIASASAAAPDSSRGLKDDREN
jgi:hypothetical protein